MSSYFNEECTDPKDCFLHRTYALPLVHSTVDAVGQTYTKAKRFSPALNTVLDSVEGSVKVTTDVVEPFYRKYLFGTVCLASKIACRGLDSVENRYPAISKTTPEDVRRYADGVYEDSIVKKSVDTVRSAKANTVAKVNGSVTFVRNHVVAVISYAENMVDSYVADDVPVTSTQKFDYNNAAILTRVVRIPYRIYLGGYYKTRRYAYEIQLMVIRAVQNVRDTIEVGKKRVVAVGASAYDSTEQLALRGIRSSTFVLALVSDKIMMLGEKATSLTMVPLTTSNAYLHTLDKKAKTVTLSQIAAESSETITEAGKILVSALNSVLDNDAEGKKKKLN